MRFVRYNANGTVMAADRVQIDIDIVAGKLADLAKELAESTGVTPEEALESIRRAVLQPPDDA